MSRNFDNISADFWNAFQEIRKAVKKIATIHELGVIEVSDDEYLQLSNIEDLTEKMQFKFLDLCEEAKM